MLRICNHCGHLNTHTATTPHTCASCGKITEVNGRHYPTGKSLKTHAPDGTRSTGCTLTDTRPPREET